MSTNTSQTRKNLIRHQFRAQLHDARVLINEFWKTLVLFFGILLIGGLILFKWYTVTAQASNETKGGQ